MNCATRSPLCANEESDEQDPVVYMWGLTIRSDKYEAA